MHRLDTLRSRCARSLAAMILTTGLTAVHMPAQAVFLNQMQATAFQNTIQTDDRVVPVSATTPVTAAVSLAGGDATASAQITLLEVSASSRDVQSLFVGANTIQYSAFTFWNTATDSAYSAVDLAGASLIVDYQIAGEAQMPTVGNARSTSFTYDTQLYIGVGFDAFNGGATLACGPVGCSAFGSPTLTPGTNTVLGTHSLALAITANTGQLFSSLTTSGGGGAASEFALSLTGLRQSGIAPLPLGLKFSDGTIVGVTPVPLPGVAGLMCAAVGLLGLRGRRARLS